MAKRLQARLTKAEARRFGFVLGGAFVALAGLLWWRGHEVPRNIAAAIALGLVLLALIVPALLRPVYVVWMAFGKQLSRITTPVFMALVFFLAILPIGLLRRTFGTNPIIHSPTKGSYWKRRDMNRRRSNLQRQF